MTPLSSHFIALLLLITIEAVSGARRDDYGRAEVELQAYHETQKLAEAIDPLTGNIVLQPVNAVYQYVGGGDSGGGGGSNSNEAQTPAPTPVDHRKYAVLDDTAAAVGSMVVELFHALLRILEAIGTILFTLLLAVLATVYVHRVLTLLGVRANYIIGAILLLDLLVLAGGLFLALLILNIDPGEIFIGMGLLSYSLVGPLSKTATEVVQGFSVKIDPRYDVGQEISVLSNRYRGIVHSKLLTEIVFDLQSPLMPEGSQPRPIVTPPRTAPAASSGAHVVMIEEIEEFRFLSMSYSQFLAEERIFHKYHRTYVPSPMRRRANMGVHLDDDLEAGKSHEN